MEVTDEEFSKAEIGNILKLLWDADYKFAADIRW